MNRSRRKLRHTCGSRDLRLGPSSVGRLLTIIEYNELRTTLSDSLLKIDRANKKIAATMDRQLCPIFMSRSSFRGHRMFCEKITSSPGFYILKPVGDWNLHEHLSL